NDPGHGDSVTQALQLTLDFLHADVDLVEVNASCPNVVDTASGKRKPIMGYDSESMRALIDAMGSIDGAERRLGLKLPPYTSEDQRVVAIQLADVLREGPFAYLVMSNTVPVVAPEGVLSIPDRKAGLSGPKTAAIGREQLEFWRGLVPDID